jgi:hypothetical protein
MNTWLIIPGFQISKVGIRSGMRVLGLLLVLMNTTWLLFHGRNGMFALQARAKSWPKKKGLKNALIHWTNLH